MNQYCVPDWSMDDESESRTLHDLLPTSSQKPDNELVELLWRDGHVVMQGQGNRKPPPTVPSNLIQEDGPSSWFQYPLDDSLEREFSEFFGGINPATDRMIYANRPNKDVLVEGVRDVRFGATGESNTFTMPPPKFGSTDQAPSLGNSGGDDVNLLPYSKPTKDGLGSRMGGVGIGESSSGRTVGSSTCGSNQADISHNLHNVATSVLCGRGAKEVVRMNPLHGGAQTNTFDPTVTSSSGGSGYSFGRTVGQQSASDQNHKRKGRDGEDSECHSEEAEYESIEANRSAHRSASTRKSRAAEVHNLSERRRRDRINEKMKALQELIPHCNKSDKASMLDEAIEYLKSLQLQLQIMWMGSGMAPMMFPGVQHYMSRLGIGMGHASMASMNNPIQLPRAPLVNHSMPSNQMPMCPSQVLNPINFPNQMQNVQLPESSAQYLGFPHMQLPQAMNLYAYGSHMMQQNKTAAAAGSSSLPTAGIPSEKSQSGQSAKDEPPKQFKSRSKISGPSLDMDRLAEDISFSESLENLLS